MLEIEFIPHLQSNDLLSDYWFMQDGARPHRTPEVFQLLNQHFGSRIKGMDYPNHFNDGIEWPPYSPNLRPCDYFLWGYLKDKVWEMNPTSIPMLKTAIANQIKKIPPELCEKVVKGFEGRLTAVIAKEGGHLEHLYH